MIGPHPAVIFGPVPLNYDNYLSHWEPKSCWQFQNLFQAVRKIHLHAMKCVSMIFFVQRVYLLEFGFYPFKV